MSTLKATKYALELNDPVLAKFKAYNLIGWSDFSPQTTSSGTISTEPKAPPTLVTEGANTDDNQMHVLWQALTGDDTGTEAISHYEVRWDAGDPSGEPIALLALELSPSFTF